MSGRMWLYLAGTIFGSILASVSVIGENPWQAGAVVGAVLTGVTVSLLAHEVESAAGRTARRRSAR